MDGLQYCMERIAPVGANDYYLSLWLPSGLRGRYLAVMTLRHELLDIIDKVQDGQVALAKLDWWRGELDKTVAGLASHPLTVLIQPWAQSDPQLVGQLRRMCDGVEMLLHTGRLASESAFEQFCDCLGGDPWTLLAKAAGIEDLAVLAEVRSVGKAITLLEVMQQVAAAARRGVMLIPVPMMQRCQLTVNSWQGEGPGQPFISAITEWDGLALDWMSALHQAGSFHRHRRVWFVMDAGRMAETTLAEIRLAGWDSLLRQRISLTPLRKMWICWRTRVLG